MKQLTVIFAILLGVTACRQSDGGDAARRQAEVDSLAMTDPDVWRIAVMPTLECLPLVLAKDHGFFEQKGLGVVLCMYESQMDVDTALQQQRVDVAVTDLVRAARLQREGLLLRRYSATDAAWQLVTKRTARIKQLKQLDDKMVAMTRYSATDMLADMAVDSARLKSERVFRIQVNNIAVRLGMLQNDIMDAMFLPEPHATTARNLKAQVLLDTKKMGLRLGVLVLNEDRMPGRDEQLQIFRKAYDEAVDSLNRYGCKNYAHLIQQAFGVSSTTIDSLAATAPQFSHIAEPRKEDLKRVDDWWKKRQDSMRYVEKRYIQ